MPASDSSRVSPGAGFDRLQRRHAEHGHAGGQPGGDPDLGVLDHHALPRLDAERGHRLQVGRGVRLARGHLVPADAQLERVDAEVPADRPSTISAIDRGVVVTSAAAQAGGVDGDSRSRAPGCQAMP